MENLQALFKNPGSAYRGKPFWAWNGTLEETELRRQIRMMYKMGLGGFFMHSRVGLGTPYLSEQWMELVEACVDEAEKLNMEAWLYDEDRWPSGAAGGLVTKDPRYRLKRLVMELHDNGEARWTDDVLGIWTGVIKDFSIFRLQVIRKNDLPVKLAEGQVLLIFRTKLEDCSPWYNGFTYLDTMSHEAVAKFIEVTHEAYRKRIGKFFGSIVPGIFTDEPNHGHTNCHWKPAAGASNTEEIPWTTQLPKFFKERYGYDILEHLPELFFDVEGQPISQARYHYHDCKTFLFVDAFARQVGEWCEKNRLHLTGHVLAEENPTSQTNVIGSAMRFYEYMQAPGIDILTEPNREYDTAKQCASVLRQTGRKWMLSELYGCTGWDFSFEGHKAVGDWQAALGVNLRCQHLYWYTMSGQAKRDYPASIAHQSPWWQDYSKVEDYFARIGAVMTQGEVVRHLLVIHPLESTWVRCRANFYAHDDVKELNQKIETLRDWLLADTIDFDYGDEEMLSRLAKIEMEGNEPTFQVGHATYKAVLIPPTLTLRQSTIDLLEKFRDAGGTVVFTGDVAHCADAEPSEIALSLATKCKHVDFERQAVVGAVESQARTLSIIQPDGTNFDHALYMLRQDEGARYLFVVNTDRVNGYENLRLRLEGTGFVEEWDAATGARYLADFEVKPGQLLIRTNLPASGSRLFVIKNEKSKLSMKRPVLNEKSRVELDVTSQPVFMNEPNVLVLDQPRFQIDGGRWNESLEILKVDRMVRDYLNLPQRGGTMVQPWARKVEAETPSCEIKLEYSFHAKYLPESTLMLALEQPERYDIAINGHKINRDDDHGWWVDRCLRLLPVDPTFLKPGENRLLLAGHFDEKADLETSFLLGQFGVRLQNNLNPEISNLDKHLKIGNWVEQGLPFYSGAVTYRASFDWNHRKHAQALLSIPKFEGACLKIFVNGENCGVIGWQPYEMKLTPFLKSGSNDIGIQVISSRHNGFGPLHQAPPEPAWVGPENFVTQNKRWQDAYNLRPCGLLAKPFISIRE